jgi:hypothetical protein
MKSWRTSLTPKELRAVAAGSRAQLAATARAFALHRARPVGDRVFPLEEVPARSRMTRRAEGPARS